MGINRGKQFEEKLEEQFEKLENISFDRIYDVTMGYKGVNNPCDFILYKRPNILYLECKAKNDNTLNFKSDIRENQWNKLLEHTEVDGVNAGIICWFIKHDKTVYLPIEWLEYMRRKGYKSFNIKKDMNVIPVLEVIGKKKKVFFDYNLNKFLEDISYE